MEQSPKDYQMLVMIFGAASFPLYCQLRIKKTGDYCDDPSFSLETIETMKRHFYIVDFLKSVVMKLRPLNFSTS